VNKVVKLRWITEAEINNDFFTIERSADGNTFEVVDIVPGAGNSSSTRYYYTVDHNPLTGVSYYRLKQTDYDGKSAYSQLVSVNSSDVNELMISYFASSRDEHQLLYQITGAENNNLSIELIDILGRSIYSAVIPGGATDRGFTISVPDLPSGVYIFKVSDGEHVAFKKFYY